PSAASAGRSTPLPTTSRGRLLVAAGQAAGLPFLDFVGVPQRQAMELRDRGGTFPASGVRGESASGGAGEFRALRSGPQLDAGVLVDDAWIHGTRVLPQPGLWRRKIGRLGVGKRSRVGGHGERGRPARGEGTAGAGNRGRTKKRRRPGGKPGRRRRKSGGDDGNRSRVFSLEG